MTLAFLQPNCRLLDADLLALGRGLLRQRQLEHAVGEFRLGFRLVDFRRQGEAAGELAVEALAVQHALVFPTQTKYLQNPGLK